MDDRDEELDYFGYDPEHGPDPQEWLLLDEQERSFAIELYHEQMTEPHPATPNLDLHVHLHAIVENQVALGDPAAAPATLKRLIAEGLDRHEAVHAVGSVVASCIFEALQSPSRPFDPVAYARELEALTADSWRVGDGG